MRHRITAILLILSPLAPADPADWAEGSGEQDGATRDFYNRAALLAWKNKPGDYEDANGRYHGDKAYAETRVKDSDTPRRIEWDVTALVNAWINRDQPNRGFFLLGQGGTIEFASRESGERGPVLALTSGTRASTLPATADTFLEPSTYRSMGTRRDLKVSGQQPALLRFDLAGQKPVSRAILRLYTTRQYGDSVVGVYRCAQGHHAPPVKPRPGLAAKYKNDRDIAEDPRVVFACDFEQDWTRGWTQVAPKERLDIVERAPRGKVLRVHLKEGANTALNTLFKFKPAAGAEPEETYFRYFLMLDENWQPTVEGGKMPGISGTYGIAGWGGRKSNGRDGWSARGAFQKVIPKGNPLAGLHPMGTYCYHAEMKGTYGDIWLWQDGYRGYLENGRWYCIEQYLKLNDPGAANGILRVWVDGRPAFEKENIRFRTTNKLKIEQVWMNVYHGGRQPAPRDMHLYIDNVVIATAYIGR